MIKIYLTYTAAVSVVTFLLFGYDKHRAKKNKSRLSEGCLLFFSSFGGATGALLGMKAFHHKTNTKTKFHFTLGNSFAFALQAILGIFIFLWEAKLI